MLALSKSKHNEECLLQLQTTVAPTKKRNPDFGGLREYTLKPKPLAT